MILPPEALPLLAEFSSAFTEPTYRRFVTLLLAAVLTTGRRTVANLLRTLGGLAPGHRTDNQRVLSRPGRIQPHPPGPRRPGHPRRR